ncbi:MAG: hypothetical protein NWR49_09200, partial [Crocinitomicaceae bacterium]|nr:hypothetical protein [Crocinitomicaceae bacterium]
MKKLHSFLLLSLFGLQVQMSFAQLFVASGESINATSSAVFYSKEALAGSGTFKLSSATMQLNPNANYTATAHKIQTTSGTISTVGIAANTDFTVGQLEMMSSSTLALAGSTVHTLRFSPSSTQAWTGTLTITGWQGAYNGTTGTKGKVFFGSSASGLLASQVLKIKFYDGTSTYDAAYLTTGEVVPVASAIQTSTNLAAAMCLGSAQTISFTYNNATNFGSSTTFTAQLSDATGAFTSPTAIGMVAGNSSGSQSISATIPSSLTGGSAFRIRVVSNTPSVTGSDNGTDIYIKAFEAGAIASTGESICSGASTSEITSTTAASGGDNSITYSWRSSEDSYTAAIAGATAATYTPPTNLTTATSYRRYAADGLCNTTPVASTGTWTVGISISLAGTISGSNSVCSGSGTTLTLAGHSGSIQWEKSNALNGTYSAISSATSPTLSTGNLTAATYYRAAVTNGSCTTSNSDAFLVDVVGTLTNIASITGPATATLGSTVTFSVPVDANAVSFIWDLPAGMTITSSSSSGSTINVAVANNYVTGIVKVKAVNSCFSTPLQTKTVSAPGQAGISITTTQVGAPVICGGITNVPFSVPTATGATYFWSLPTGLALSSGSSSSSASIEVDFAASYVGGTITCTRSTSAGSLSASYTVGAIAQPGTITQGTSLCGATSTTYSITEVPNATSYQWQLPTGMTGSSTSTSITASFSGSVSGSVQVRAIGTCGTSAWRYLSVASTPTPSAITGPAVVCGAATYTITGTIVSQVSQTTLNYSVTNIPGTTYTWSVPSGMDISSGQGTNAIVVTLDQNSFNSGAITVLATNNGCTSAIRTLSVSKATATITGPTGVCGITSATYSVPSDAGSAFSWTLPSWMTLVSGQGTNMINVTMPATGTSAQALSVDITTACGVVSVSQNVGCGLYTQLESAYCGASVAASQSVLATWISGATSYRF